LRAPAARRARSAAQPVARRLQSASAGLDVIQYDLVIPTLGCDSLTRSLDALCGSKGPRPRQLVVVDDRREPERALRLPSSVSSHHLVCIVATGGCGVAAARNAGARVGVAEWLVFLDDDVLPDPDWCERLELDLRSLPRGVAISHGLVRSSGAPGRNGADVAVRRDLFAALGGFDERFRRPHREGAELVLRADRAGLRAVRGRRAVTPAPSPSHFLDGVRAQAGNADDALLGALHGSDWREKVGEPRSRLQLHVLWLAAGLVSFAAALIGAPRVSRAALCVWLLAAVELAAHRAGRGPLRVREILRAAATSLLIPPAAVGWAAWGRLRALRLRGAGDRSRTCTPCGNGF
jgi:glycosyl transferase family 2